MTRPGEPTHRDLARAAARWLLEDRGIYAAAYELGFDGGQADAVGVTVPDPDASVALRVDEHTRAYHRNLKQYPAHAAGLVGRPAWLDGYRARSLARARVAPRVVVVEVKRTRSDLLADLRVGKLRRYESAATHCYLLIAGPCVGLSWMPWWPEEEQGRALHVLAADGLPDAWGVLGAVQGRQGVRVERLRAPGRIREAEPWEVQAWADRMLRSMSHRILSRTGPTSGEVVEPSQK